jgi:hypothetical protein
VAVSAFGKKVGASPTFLPSAEVVNPYSVFFAKKPQFSVVDQPFIKDF